MGKDEGADAVVEAAIATLKKLGAVIVDPIKCPPYLLAVKQPLYNTLVTAEFKAQLTECHKTTKPDFPKSFDEVVALSNDPKTNFRTPGKAFGLKYNSTRTLSFLGLAFTKVKLLGYGFDFEPATKASATPKFTPALSTDILTF